MTGKIEMGWGAKPIADQFPQLPIAEANRLQADSDAITHLSMRRIITRGERDKAVKRFAGRVSRALAAMEGKP